MQCVLCCCDCNFAVAIGKNAERDKDLLIGNALLACRNLVMQSALPQLILLRQMRYY